jgi:hypothetical protein
MKPTSIWMLVALALVAGGVAYVLTVHFYADVPSPPTLAPLTLLLIALAEAYVASSTRARMAGRPGTRPIDPIFVAKLAALAKASSPVGALALGAYTGFLVDVTQRSGSTAASNDTRTAALGMGCSLGLVLGALLLERVCRAKPPDDETN